MAEQLLPITGSAFQNYSSEVQGIRVDLKGDGAEVPCGHFLPGTYILDIATVGTPIMAASDGDGNDVSANVKKGGFLATETKITVSATAAATYLIAYMPPARELF